MNKEKAIELIQVTNKGLSRAQIEALIQAEVKAAAGLLTEEAAIYLVLKNLGIAAPTPAAAPVEAPVGETFAERRARMEAEPDKSGTFLKADKAQVGDLVKITAVALEAAKTIDTDRGPVDIPARPQITGDYKAKGQGEWGQEVKFSLSKSNEKNIYKLWGKPLDQCIGMTLMVVAIQKKTINGHDATWLDWTGLPAS